MAVSIPTIKNLESFRQQLVAILNAIDSRTPLTGSGSPEGVVIADTGTLFLRTDGGASTSLYVKTAGDGLATGWTAK